MKRGSIYRDEQLARIAFPLGGIGTGNVSLAGNGYLTEWQLANHVNKGAKVETSFFAVRVKPAAGKPVTRVLAELREPVMERFESHFSLPHMDRVEFIGEYPIGTIRYFDRDIPVNVKLEAYTPFVHGDARDSGLPCAVFTFIARNRTKRLMEVSFGACFLNVIGWDGYSEILGWCLNFGGNQNRVLRGDRYVALHMENPTVPKESPHFGTMAIAALDPKATYITQCRTGENPRHVPFGIQEFWKALVQETSK